MRCRMLLVAAAVAGAACALSPEVAGFRAPAEDAREVVKGYVWLEAESFRDYGGWRIDTQFTHKMGSAYLLAAGVLKPLAAAKTTLGVPRAGKWRAWARTKDWLPEYSPGKFRISVGGKTGPTLGASGKDGWRWEKAGEWDLQKGDVEIALEDLSGSFARCDAILFTQDLSYAPGDGAEECERARAKFTGAAGDVGDAGEFGLVVVGAGPGGMGAAIAAARHGVRVALVHDRPVLGGNASCELGVPTDGAAVSHANAREGGICEEVNLRKALTAERTLSAAFREMAEELPNLHVFANERVMSVEKDGDRIAAVVARGTLDGARRRWRGRLFADCTGDGWVGVFAGAKRMYGREARSEYNEAPAPEVRDDLTMSGCLMGGYLGYRQLRMGDAPVPYETPEWARVLPPGFTRNTDSPWSQWWVEHGGRFDDLVDPERARDELVRINLAYWGWLKNEWEGRERIRNNALVEMAHMNGRREGYRLVGDYILTANDCLEGRVFDDRISYGGWPLDTHDPLGMENPNGNGYWKHHPSVPIYTIPFRCLYSTNVPNLMVAGRSVSVTHIALGSTRVESTILTMGQAVGTAAAKMLRKGLMPREYGADMANIRDLQQTLLKDDQYIPGIANDDPDDLARGAKVTASSTCLYKLVPKRMIEVRGKKRGDVAHPLNMPRVAGFSRGGLKEMKSFECLLECAAKEPVEVTARVYVSEVPASDSARALDASALRMAGRAKAVVKPGKRRWVRFAADEPIALDAPYVWVQLGAAKGVKWFMTDKLFEPLAFRGWGVDKWTLVPNVRYAMVPEGGFRFVVDSRPEYAVDGFSRTIGAASHCWMSDPDRPFPQTLTLEFPEPVPANEVRLTFDSDLNPLHPIGNPLPPTLVKGYAVEGFDGKGWTALAEVEKNGVRHRVHRFSPRMLKAVRLRVDSTWGDPSARVFEVRVQKAAMSAVLGERFQKTRDPADKLAWHKALAEERHDFSKRARSRIDSRGLYKLNKDSKVACLVFRKTERPGGSWDEDLGEDGTLHVDWKRRPNGAIDVKYTAPTNWDVFVNAYHGDVTRYGVKVMKARVGEGDKMPEVALPGGWRVVEGEEYSGVNVREAYLTFERDGLKAPPPEVAVKWPGAGVRAVYGASNVVVEAGGARFVPSAAKPPTTFSTGLPRMGAVSSSLQHHIRGMQAGPHRKVPYP